VGSVGTETPVRLPPFCVCCLVAVSVAPRWRQVLVLDLSTAVEKASFEICRRRSELVEAQLRPAGRPAQSLDVPGAFRASGEGAFLKREDQLFGAMRGQVIRTLPHRDMASLLLGVTSSTAG